MEKFKAEIQSRNKRVVLAASIIFFVYIYLSRKTGVPDAMNDLVAGYNLGLLIALQVGAIYFITKYNKALKSNDQLKKLYIELHDERKKLIQYKSSVIGMSIFIFILLLATIISGFYNLIVFYSVLRIKKTRGKKCSETLEMGEVPVPQNTEGIRPIRSDFSEQTATYPAPGACLA